MDPLVACSTLTARLADELLPPVAEQPGCREWDPWNLVEFFPAIEVAQAHASGSRFLGVGCGIGCKLVLASELGFQVSGFDIRPEYVQVARRLCPEAALLVADAREFAGYGSFDVIYCYFPLLDESEEWRLDDRIAEQMAPGAVLMLPGHPDRQPVGLARIGYSVWQKR